MELLATAQLGSGRGAATRPGPLSPECGRSALGPVGLQPDDRGVYWFCDEADCLWLQLCDDWVEHETAVHARFDPAAVAAEPSTESAVAKPAAS